MAFAITALALGIVFQIYAKGTTAAILSEEYAQAITIGESKLAMADISGFPLYGEQYGWEKNKYKWTLESREFTGQSDADFILPLSLMEIVVTVSWQSRGHERLIKLQTLKPVTNS